MWIKWILQWTYFAQINYFILIISIISLFVNDNGLSAHISTFCFYFFSSISCSWQLFFCPHFFHKIWIFLSGRAQIMSFELNPIKFYIVAFEEKTQFCQNLTYSPSKRTQEASPNVIQLALSYILIEDPSQLNKWRACFQKLLQVTSILR